MVSDIIALVHTLHGHAGVGATTKATVGGGTPNFSGVFEPFARVALYPTDEDGLGACFGAT